MGDNAITKDIRSVKANAVDVLSSVIENLHETFMQAVVC